MMNSLKNRVGGWEIKKRVLLNVAPSFSLNTNYNLRHINKKD